jgi:hypothetical protein
VAPWLNWIEQPPPKGQVAGSNPAGVTIVACVPMVPKKANVCAKTSNSLRKTKPRMPRELDLIYQYQDVERFFSLYEASPVKASFALI